MKNRRNKTIILGVNLLPTAILMIVGYVVLYQFV